MRYHRDRQVRRWADLGQPETCAFTLASRLRALHLSSPEHEPAQEQDAIRRCQAGELYGLGVLFELHHRAVFRTAYGVVRRHDVAEDVTQQVFIELFRAIKRYDNRRPFAPWLYRIVVNRSLDELRRRKERTVPIESVREPPSPAASPEDLAEASELRATIRDALSELDGKHRAAVVLRYYRGFSEAEMAVALGCSPGTVKSRLHYALRRLREALGETEL